LVRSAGALTGIVFDIMKYAIHDGPGIRTIVFLKGCPLDCWWCHNPEGKSPGREIMVWESRCIGCGECARACRYGAISEVDGRLVSSPDRCRRCFACVEACCADAREAVGKEMTVEQVMKEIEKDRIFYEESGGGVTFSGGEPLMQPEFLNALLEASKDEELHTAVETAGYAKWEDLLAASEKTDLFLYDLKLMDDGEHRKFTGVPNGPILENLEALSAVHDHVIVRVPVIPGVNDHEANITRMGRFLSESTRVKEVHLLPYHKAGAEKYGRLNVQRKMPELEPPDDETMNTIAERLRSFGKTVKIGG